MNKTRKKITNGKEALCTSEKTLQTEKENLFSNFKHAPSSSSYQGLPSETNLAKNISSKMKDLCKKDELEKMSSQGEIHSESQKNTCLEKATAAKKVLCDDYLDKTMDDFQESQIEKKLKLKKKLENPVFACVVCQSDITHLDLEERAVHINQCIDGHSSSVIPSQETATENAFILDCPLCFKHFPTSEARCGHIKKCGKSRGLSTQSVIQALRLQEKHVLERRALGLPLNNKPTKQPKKPTAKKFLIKPKSTMESDLHLAKALSLSLEENENKPLTNFDSAASENSQPSIVLEAPSELQNPGKFVSKKKTVKPIPLLLLQSEDERQKVLLEKVNSIIASTSEFKGDVITEDVKYNSSEQKRTILWNLCGKLEGKKAYYVEQLLDWISPSDIEVGSKLCNLSQIAGHRIFTQLPCDYTFSSDKSDDGNSINEDNESPSIIKSLRSLIGNCWMSDVDIHTRSGIVIPAHKLFLALRCPSLKNAFDKPETSGKHILNWENTSFDAALHFLNFIYTGSAEWKEDIIDELHKLAVKYEVHDLLNILDSNKETLEMLICEDAKENIEDTMMDTEVPSEDNCQNTSSSAEQKHGLGENKNTLENNEIESQDMNRGCFNDEDALNEATYSNSKNLKNLVSDQDDVVCIQDTETAKEMVIIENISSEKDHVDEDILVLNKPTAFHADKNNEPCDLNLVTCDEDSNSSNDSCKILKSNLSSEIKTSFDAFQEEVINIVCSKTTDSSVSSTNYAPSCITPSKTLVGNIYSPSKNSRHLDNLLSPNKSPFTPHKSSFNEYIYPGLSSSCTEKITISPGNSLFSSFKTDFKVRCSEKNDSIPVSIDEQNNEAVIILDDENNESETRKTNNVSFLTEIRSVDNPENIKFSPQKVSPWKVSKLKSPSFNDFDAVPRSLPAQIRRANFEQRDLDVQHPFSKGCSISPNASRFSNTKESPKNCYALSPKARPEVSIYNKDKSFKRKLECSLNDNVYPMDPLSSPEILVCDSDNELEPVVIENSLSKNEYVPEREYSSNNEAAFCNEDRGTPDSVFTSNFGENGSFTKEKTVVPEVICCNSESDNETDVTIELQSTRERNCTKFKKDDELNEINIIQHDELSDKSICTPIKTNENNPVLEIIDCCSNSNDNIDAIKGTQSISGTKEIFEDECMDFIPLSERIEAAKSKTNSSKAFENPILSSPESPWIFQTDKPCDAKPLENILKSSTCTSQNNSDSTPKHPMKHSKKKNLCSENQSEKNNSVNGLQPKFKISDSPVTPLPDYKSMMTPDLKQALKKVGVKPLPRKKAVAVLSHIYNETHPWNDDQTGETSQTLTQSSPKSSSLKKNLSLPKKRKQSNEISDQLPKKKTAKSHLKTITQVKEAATKINSKPKPLSNIIQSSSPEQMSSLKTKTPSPDIMSSPDGLNNSRENYYNLSSDLSDSSQSDSKDKIKNVTQYITSSNELYKKILNYSPLNLMEFHHELKENGISISVSNLMNYFDEQCITFTCPRKEEYKKKQQARSQRFRKRMIAKISQQKSQSAF